MSMDFKAFIKKIQQNNWEVYGVEVYERHKLTQAYGETAGKRFPIYSATKTVTSLAVGMAVDEGKLDIDRSVLAYLPQKVISDLSEERQEPYRKITIERLLTMSVLGFPFRPEGGSWLYNSLRYPITPDERAFDYSNVSAYLAGVAASCALGEDLYQYLQRKLFEPLGIENPPFQRCPDGYFYGASGMELTVNELSRIGFVLMDNGIYQGKRIVSEEYIRKACSVRQMNREGGYGYFIWKVQDGFSINGKWGQKCYIFPQKQLMVTFLGHVEEGEGQLKECMEECLN